MKKAGYIIKVLLVGIAVVFLGSCSLFMGPDSLEKDSRIWDESKVDCDYLFMLYLDGDNNLNDYLFDNLLQCEYGLYFHNRKHPESSVKILVLWDGINKEDNSSYEWEDRSNLVYYHPESALYELGERYYNPEYSDRYISSSTRDITYKALDWFGIDEKQGTFEVNMGSPATLTSFLSFAASRYNPSVSVLLMSDHGQGPFSFTDSPKLNESSGRLVCMDNHSPADNIYKVSWLDTNKISKAILDGWGKPLDILMFDACLYGTVETLYEFRKCTSYLVASPNSIPGYGFPYINILGNGFMKSDSREEFCSKIVEEYAHYYSKSAYNNYLEGKNNGGRGCSPYDEGCDLSPTLSAYRTDKVSSLREKIDIFVDTIISDESKELRNLAVNETNLGFLCPKLVEEQQSIGSVKSLWYYGTYNILIDMGYLCDMYSSNSYSDMKMESEIKEVCEQLKDALDDCIVSSWRAFCISGSVEGLYPSLNDRQNYYGLPICSARISFDDLRRSNYSVMRFYESDYRRSTSFGKDSKWGMLLSELFESGY